MRATNVAKGAGWWGEEGGVAVGEVLMRDVVERWLPVTTVAPSPFLDWTREKQGRDASNCNEEERKAQYHGEGMAARRGLLVVF